MLSYSWCDRKGFSNFLIYLDDIIVFSTDLEQHLDSPVTLFERLRTARLKLEPEKCLLFQKSVSFLWYVVSS